MKKLKIITTQAEFEEFVNNEEVEIIQLDIKACEQNSFAQENFMAVVYYKN